jgi:hypothetical protein
MPYLTLAMIAARASITPDSARTYHKRATANRDAGDPRPGDLPAPDVRLGTVPAWEESTISAWLTARPRKPIPAIREGADHA